MLITPGDSVISADGTYPMAPGDYVAVGRVGGEVVTDEVPFTIDECPVEPTPTPTATPTATPTGEVIDATGTPGPTATPTGEVLPATGTPTTTLPPTDTLGSATPPAANDGWRLILLAMAGLLAATLLLTPAQSVVGKGRRR